MLPEKQTQATSAVIEHFPRNLFSLPKDQGMVGELAEVELQEHDSLALIGRYYGLGFDEITLANPHLDPWVPSAGSLALLPLQFILPDSPRRGMVVNLSAKRLFYFPKDSPDTVYSYPIGIGRQGWETPLGITRIVAKKKHPTWTVPASIRREHRQKGDPLPAVVPAGPQNPLGDYAMRLAIPGYLIHGTNKPYGVGMQISHGCVRLFPEDIANLFDKTIVGTPVTLVDQPYLTAWNQGRLYLVAYPPARNQVKVVNRHLDRIKKRLRRIERQSGHKLDWEKVEAALARSDGVPVLIAGLHDTKSAPLRLAHPPPGYGNTTPAPLQNNAWRLWLTTSENEQGARRLAAMLNHQGPPIPAHVVAGKKVYAVVAGPFVQKTEAAKVAAQVSMEFSLEPRLLKPGEQYPDFEPSLEPEVQSWANFWDWSD